MGGRYVVIVQLSLLGLSCVHFALKVWYGNKRADDGVSMSTEPLLNVGIGEIMRDPNVLYEEKHKHILKFFKKLMCNWIGSGIAAILFTLSIGDADADLITCSKLYQTGPYYIHKHLGESVTVIEDVAREILQCDASDKGESTTSHVALEINAQGISEACETFRQEALTFDGMHVISCLPDMESAVSKKVSLPPLTLFDLVYKPWWPLQIILKDEFQRTWVIHSTSVMIADVDCTADGKDLCEKHGVQGFPTIKYGDPDELKDYEGGRDYDSLKAFAESSLGPQCGPGDNIGLCSDKVRAKIEKYLKMTVTELEGKINNATEKVKVDVPLMNKAKAYVSKQDSKQEGGKSEL